jgi:ADP-ribosyl-[dinitrogen reductase] hydrolase
VAGGGVWNAGAVVDVLLERIEGGLLGVGAGDALGATVEFCSPQRIAAEYGVHAEIVGGGAFGWRPGQGTDDSDLTACVARSYASGYGLHDVAQRFLRWYGAGPRDIGGLTARALGWLAEHGDPVRSGAAVASGDSAGNTAGNGSLMRALPTALAGRDAHSDGGTRRREAAEISAITHADPRCVESCQVYVELAAALLAGLPVAAAVERGRAVARHPEVTGALDADHRRDVSALPTTGYVIHSLAAAVWAVQQPAPFEQLVVAVVNRGDDADTTGAIVGGLLGVRDGVSAIPDRWLERLEYRKEFTELAAALAVRDDSGAHLGEL